jgi:hypothetical protein
MRRTVIVALILGAVIGQGQARADQGWVRSQGTWIKWSFTFHHPPALKGRGLITLLASQKAAAIHRAIKHRRTHLRRLAALLRRTRAILTSARAVVSGGVWACVARWEEGGMNTASHGYFGFMGSPPGGESWLSLSWAAQVAIAEGIQRHYGWTAWGPHTRAMCGL